MRRSFPPTFITTTASTSRSRLQLLNRQSRRPFSFYCAPVTHPRSSSQTPTKQSLSTRFYTTTSSSSYSYSSSPLTSSTTTTTASRKQPALFRKRLSTDKKFELSKQQTRACSYRRAMCRSAAGGLRDDTMGGGGGSAASAKGREVLPKNVVPRHYDLTLEPNWSDFTYQGSVGIE